MPIDGENHTGMHPRRNVIVLFILFSLVRKIDALNLPT